MISNGRENKRKLITAGVWSAAVLAVLAIGILTFMSAASQKTKSKTNDETDTGTGTVTEAVTDALFHKEKETAETEGNTSGTTAATVDTAEAWVSDTPLAPIEEAEEAMAEPTEEDTPAAQTSYSWGDTFTCVMPINGTVSKGYTEDIAVYSLTMNDYRVHNGIDIDAPVGTIVSACAAGTVEKVWEDPFLGTCILIDHGGNVKSLYANLSPDLPKGMEAGATVLAGDAIGGVGETMVVEMADSDHLHFCISRDGVYIDPMSVITNYQGGEITYDE